MTKKNLTMTIEEVSDEYGRLCVENGDLRLKYAKLKDQNDVSHSTFLDLLDSMGRLIENVDFFVNAAFRMDAWEKSVNFIHDQIEKAKKELSEIEEKALEANSSVPDPATIEALKKVNDGFATLGGAT